MACQPAVPERPLPGQDPCFANPEALLKHLAETPRLARVTPATRLEVRPAPEMVSFGIAALDQLTGGLPRGCLTEVSGPDSSGRTSVLLATLAAATRRGEICALIDASDAFHPRSAVAAGIDLTRLLWVRCTPTPPARARGNSRSAKSGADFRKGSFSNDQRPTTNDRFNDQRLTTNDQLENPVEQALRAADLLLQSGGFGLIAIDLAGVPVKIARRIPLTTWFRFRRAIEPTPTILLAIGEQPCAQTCATLCLQMEGQDRTSVESRSLGKKPSAFSTQHSAVSGQLSALSSQLSAISSRISAELQGARFDPRSEIDTQLSIFDSARVSVANSHPLVQDPELEIRGSALAERRLELAARSSQLEAPPQLEARSSKLAAHTHLLESLPIRVKLLRSRLERKPAQSVTTFFSQSTDHPGRDGAYPGRDGAYPGRDGACPVSACPVSACTLPARSAPTHDAPASNVNAFALRAHQLRAHG